MGAYAQKLALRLLEIPYVRIAVDTKTLHGEPTPRLKPRFCVGLGLMALSYLICWPLIGLLGMISLKTRSPGLIGIGGPALYGISHLIFLMGVYLAGMESAKQLARQATRKFISKLLGAPVPSAEQPPWGA